METQTPALFDHCVSVYTAMRQNAAPQTIDGVEVMVYEGYLTKLIKELGLSVPYYTHVTQLLRAMDCARQERRGGGGSKSRWVLIQEPTKELYQVTTSQPSAARPTRKQDQVMQMLFDLNERITRLERMTLRQ